MSHVPTRRRNAPDDETGNYAIFLKLCHQHLPQQHRWIIPLVDYIDTLWDDSIEEGICGIGAGRVDFS